MYHCLFHEHIKDLNTHHWSLLLNMFFQTCAENLDEISEKDFVYGPVTLNHCKDPGYYRTLVPKYLLPRSGWLQEFTKPKEGKEHFTHDLQKEENRICFATSKGFLEDWKHHIDSVDINSTSPWKILCKCVSVRARHSETTSVIHTYCIEGNHQRSAVNSVCLAVVVTINQGMLVCGSMLQSSHFLGEEEGI